MSTRPWFVFLCFLILATSAHGAPKYGPEAIRLIDEHAYIKSSVAPDYWALMAHYVPQRDGRSCSLASVTMALNALRSRDRLAASDAWATQDDVFKKTNSPTWKRGLTGLGRGVTLEQLGVVTQETFRAYGIKVQVEVVEVADTTPSTLEKVRAILLQNEKSADDILISNFLQSVYTGDAEGGGHISPVAAYDAKNKRVLIFDSDRQYYEPYWVSDATWVRGMATIDSESKRARGFVWIRRLR